ncbi:toxin glutamine deamidase domain-containing protein [Nocardia tengchongensis]|uniref:toxin glutamine deamidase domain-containing protein n=1 Tax=Nocardia tengchongensis TaxID=2055889 RepID=UPI003681B1EF
MAWTTYAGDHLFPDWLMQWLNFGAAYPKGDQDALFALGDALKHAAAELEKLEPSIKSATDRVPQYYEGEGATAALAEFAKLFDANDVHSLPKLIEGLEDLGHDARSTATEIEFAKIQAEIFAALTLWTVYSLLASFYGWAAVTPYLQVARGVLAKFSAQIAKQIGEIMTRSGLKELAAPLSREIVMPAGKAITQVGERLAPTVEKLGTPLNKWQALNQTIAKSPAVVRYPVAALKGGAMGAGLDAGSQVVQIMEGHRDGGFDLKQTFQTAIQWGAGGAAGGLGHDLTNKGLSLLGKDVPKTIGGRLTGGIAGGVVGAGGMYAAGLGTQLYDNNGNWDKVDKRFSGQLLAGGLFMGAAGGGAHGLHEQAAEIRSAGVEAGPKQTAVETASVDKAVTPQTPDTHQQPAEQVGHSKTGDAGQQSGGTHSDSAVHSQSSNNGAATTVEPKGHQPETRPGGGEAGRPTAEAAKPADNGARPAANDRPSESVVPKEAAGRPAADSAARVANVTPTDQKANLVASVQDKPAQVPAGRAPEVRSVTPDPEVRPVRAEPAAGPANPSPVREVPVDRSPVDRAPSIVDEPAKQLSDLPAEEPLEPSAQPRGSDQPTAKADPGTHPLDGDHGAPHTDPGIIGPDHPYEPAMSALDEPALIVTPMTHPGAEHPLEVRRRIDKVTGVEPDPALAKAKTEFEDFYKEQNAEAAKPTDVTPHDSGTPSTTPVYEARRYSYGPEEKLTTLTVRVHLDEVGNVSPAHLREVVDNLHATTDRVFNTGERLLSGDRLRVELEFVDDPAAAHLKASVGNPHEATDPHVLNRETPTEVLAERLREHVGLSKEDHGLTDIDLRHISNEIAHANTDNILGGLPGTRTIGPDRLGDLEHPEFQWDVEDALRDGDRFLVGADPRTNLYGELINDGGPHTDVRRYNCLEQSLAALSSFYGDPQVGLPRHFDMKADGTFNQAGESGGMDRAKHWLGSHELEWPPGSPTPVADQFAWLHNHINQNGELSAALVVNTWHALDANGNFAYDNSGNPIIAGSHATVVVYPRDASGPVWWDPQAGTMSDTPPPSMVTRSASLSFITVDPNGGIPGAGATHQGTGGTVSPTGPHHPAEPGDRPVPDGTRLGGVENPDAAGVGGGRGDTGDRGLLHSERPDRSGNEPRQRDAPADLGREVRPGDRDRGADTGQSDLSAPLETEHPTDTGGSDRDRVPGDHDVADRASGTDHGTPPDREQGNPALSDERGGNPGAGREGDGLGELQPPERDLAGAPDPRVLDGRDPREQIHIDPDRPATLTPHLQDRFEQLRGHINDIFAAHGDPARTPGLPSLRLRFAELVDQLGLRDREGWVTAWQLFHEHDVALAKYVEQNHEHLLPRPEDLTDAQLEAGTEPVGHEPNEPAHSEPPKDEPNTAHDPDTPPHNEIPNTEAATSLTPEERDALHRYTDPDTDVFSDLNHRLRNEFELSPEQQKLSTDIAAGLEKLPEYNGTVWRGTHLSPNQLAVYVHGAKITEPSLTSTSRDPRRIFTSNVEFIMHSESGRDISAISARPREKEVLFKPGTTFEVRGVVEDPNAGLFGVTRVYLYEHAEHTPTHETPGDHTGHEPPPNDHTSAQEAGVHPPEELPVRHGPNLTSLGDSPEVQRVYDNVRNEGEHDVVIHGDRFGKPTTGGGIEIDPRRVVEAIRNNPHYVEGTPVRLLSCHSGNDVGWAQHVANELGVHVRAPSDVVGVRAIPDSPAVLPKDAEWRTFHPAETDGTAPQRTAHTPTDHPDGRPPKYEEDPREDWDILGADGKEPPESPSSHVAQPKEQADESLDPTERQRRILLVCTEWDPHKGGVVSVNKNLAEGLAAAGHEVVVRVGHPVTGTEGGEGITVVGPRSFDPAVSKQEQLTSDLGDLPADVDAVVGHSRFSGFAAREIRDAMYPDAKLVHVVHMVTDALGRVAEKPELGLEFQTMERDLVSTADVAVGVGPALAEEAQRLADMFGHDPTIHEMIPGVPFEEQIPHTTKDGSRNVLMFGRADSPQKGALQAAEMVRELNARGLDVGLTVRGVPADLIDMSRTTLSAIAGREVDVRPFTIDRSEILADMRQADVVIMPSRAEGFGLVGLEAAGAGVPVLLPSTSGAGRFVGDATRFPEHIAENSVVTQGFEEPVKVEQWVDKLQNVLADPTQAQARAHELQQHLKAQDRTWRTAAEELVEAIDNHDHAKDGHEELPDSTELTHQPTSDLPDNIAHPWPADPITGYEIQPRDLKFLGLTHEQVEAWMAREAPLGMTAETYREWRASLLEALHRDGVDTRSVDIRLRGSGADFFSGAHKKLPTLEELADHPAAQAKLREWLGDDPNRPLSRPYDSMNKLGLEEPSDFDINISSREMFERAKDAWDPDRYEGSLSKDHGYLNKTLVTEEYRHLVQWQKEWNARLGRDMSYAVFDGTGPKDVSDQGFYVHFQDTDWIVHDPGRLSVDVGPDGDLSPGHARAADPNALDERHWSSGFSHAIMTDHGQVTRSEDAKTHVIQSITDRITAATDRLLGAGQEVHVDPTMYQRLGNPEYVVALRNPDYPSMGGTLLHRSEVDPSNPLHSSEHLMPLDAPGAERVLREIGVSELIQSWAHDSNGTNVKSLAIQEAAIAEFGLHDVLDWRMTDELRATIDREIAAHGDVHRELLRIQYDRTQQQLASEGVNGLVLYRGVSWAPHDFPAWATQPPGTILEMPPQRPLSSWTGDRSISSDWLTQLDKPGVILAAHFPRETILAYPQTGIGCLWQVEFVTLSRPGSVTLDLVHQPAEPGKR